MLVSCTAVISDAFDSCYLIYTFAKNTFFAKKQLLKSRLNKLSHKFYLTSKKEGFELMKITLLITDSK